MYPLRELSAGGQLVSGADLTDLVLRGAAGLAELGCRPADRVAVLMRNSLEQLAATLAVQHLGAYPVQMNWHGQVPELLYVLDDCGAAILVAHADLLARFDGCLPGALRVVRVAPDAALQAAYHLILRSVIS